MIAVELSLLALDVDDCGAVAPEVDVGGRGVPPEDGRNVEDDGFPPPPPAVEGDSVAPPPPDPVVGDDAAAGFVVGDSVESVPIATVGRRLGGAVVSAGVGAAVGSLV